MLEKGCNIATLPIEPPNFSLFPYRENWVHNREVYGDFLVIFAIDRFSGVSMKMLVLEPDAPVYLTDIHADIDQQVDVIREEHPD